VNEREKRVTSEEVTLTGEATRDGAGQPLRVGDRVAAVRLDPTHTVVGEVASLGARTCVVRVGWVSDPDPGLGAYGLRRRAGVGEETRVYLARTFRLGRLDGGEGGQVTRVCECGCPGCEHHCGAHQGLVERERRRVETRHLQLRRALGVPDPEGEGARETWLETLIRVVRLRVRGAGARGDGLREGDGETVLDRQVVQLTYAAALDRALPGYVEGSEEVRQVAWGLAEVALRVRDRELTRLRGRLALADELHQLALDVVASEREDGERDAGGHPAGCRCNEPYPCGREGDARGGE